MSRSVEERIDNAMEDNALIKFLGAENVEDLKKRIVDLIVNQVESDLQSYAEYLISPDDIVEVLTDNIVEKVETNVRSKLEKVVYERALEKLGLKE